VYQKNFLNRSLLSSLAILVYSLFYQSSDMAATVKETVLGLLGKLQVNEETTPRQPTAGEIGDIKDRYEKAGQGHVLKFIDELTELEKARLYEQLLNFDPNRINELADEALHPKAAGEQTSILDPLPESATASILDSNPDDLERWYSEGLKLVSENKVAVVLMAGGQGTRLGSSAPKGCFDIGLPSKKSLFQIQAERISKIQQLAQRVTGKQAIIPWYVMTSGPTQKSTQNFFEEHQYFGLSKDHVFLFEQGVLPCISNDGKIILESKGMVGLQLHWPLD
jgi:UDP-N-acetylglucosamine/UDP-N-acetylgalactosamine diphosphorylase